MNQHTQTLIALTALSTLLLHCSKPHDPQHPKPHTKTQTATPPPTTTPPPKTSPKPTQTNPTPNPRSPKDFAQAWANIVEEPDPSEQNRKTRALQTSWTNRVYTWDALAFANTCIDATKTCTLQAFPYSIPKRRYLGGMFPKVTFQPNSWDTLKTQCKGQPTCVVTFRATLPSSVNTMRLPLSLTFTNAHIQTTRPPQDSDAWFRPPTPRNTTPKKTLRTGSETKVPKALQVKAKVF